MNLFNKFLDLLTRSGDSSAPLVNPATGLPMIGRMTGIDTDGNPYGWDDRLDESLRRNRDE